jgi:hypothetical protein
MSDWNSENGNGRWRIPTTFRCKLFGHKWNDFGGDRELCARQGCNHTRSNFGASSDCAYCGKPFAEHNLGCGNTDSGEWKP